MAIIVGDVGAKLRIITNNKLFATPDSFTLMIKKPSGATAEWAMATPDYIDYPTGDIFYYTKTVSEVNEAGEYRVELKRIDVNMKATKSDIGNFTVKESLF
jgi:hypothetical protein